MSLLLQYFWQHRLLPAFPRFSRWRPFLAVSAALLLQSCAEMPVHSFINEKNSPHLPEQQLADFLSTDCREIWYLTGRETEANPLYWLRAMDCAERLGPAEARMAARDWQDESWQHHFKRGIILASARITPTERRQLLTGLEAFSAEIPPHVRPLYQLWHDSQALQLQLSATRSRYSKLQQTTDGTIDQLRHQQQQLRSQLSLTTRKLENLTDIERQLSSRKAPASESQEPSHTSLGEGKPAPEAGAPADKDDPTTKEEATP